VQALKATDRVAIACPSTVGDEALFVRLGLSSWAVRRCIRVGAPVRSSYSLLVLRHRATGTAPDVPQTDDFLCPRLRRRPSLAYLEGGSGSSDTISVDHCPKAT